MTNSLESVNSLKVNGKFNENDPKSNENDRKCEKSLKILLHKHMKISFHAKTRKILGKFTKIPQRSLENHKNLS